jgi:dTDP-4-dehydrorhamnose 3,5-epimerase
MKVYKHKLQGHADERGTLTAVNLPFPTIVQDFRFYEMNVRRFFYVTGVPKGVQRGAHAHKEARQVLICITGSIRVTLNDGKRNWTKILMPDHFIFVDNGIWATQQFLTGSDVLLVLCDTHYDKDDYITNFEEFKTMKRAALQ